MSDEHKRLVLANLRIEKLRKALVDIQVASDDIHARHKARNALAADDKDKVTP